MTVFANRSGKDTLRVAFDELVSGVGSVRLAAPFFSYSDGVRRLASRADVHLVVRLGPATDPRELGKLLELPNVQVRYFTSSLFHTKLYIFGSRCALVGSANLTDAGMQRNREATVTVPGLSPDFEELSALYETYWDEADVLDPARLAAYREVLAAHPRTRRDKDLEAALIKEFGLVQPSGGIQDGVPRPSAARLYLEDYRRAFQSDVTP